MKTLLAVLAVLSCSSFAHADSELVTITPVTWPDFGRPSAFTFYGSYIEDSLTGLIDPTSLNLNGNGISAGWSVPGLVTVSEISHDAIGMSEPTSALQAIAALCLAVSLKRSLARNSQQSTC